MAQYCTLDNLKQRLGITDNDDDTALDSIMDAVSAWIERYCGRVFSVPTEDATRYFTAEEGGILWAGDLISITTIQTDEDGDRAYERTWTSTDYDLLPANAADFDEPYTKIRVTPRGNYLFPLLSKSVKITGRWGWPEVPAPVIEACILQCERIFKRRDAIFGVTGSAEMGQMLVIPKLDPDVRLLLNPYQSWVGRPV